MSSVKKIDLGLTGYDELFMDDQSRAEVKLPRIYEIALDQIDDFPDHPFKVRMDEDMEQLVESICERGIITPVTLREKDDGRYELVSGHRRKKACEIAGLTTIKAEIRELTIDEAVILMVESNLQRSKILPSEKAFSYKMRLDAMKRQGQRNDLTSVPLGQKLYGVTAREELASKSGDSNTQIQRYIRLTELIPDLLDIVDEGKIALRSAVELSYLPENEQEMVFEVISCEDSIPTMEQTKQMRELSEQGRLDSETISAYLRTEKPNQKEKISFQADRIRKYLPHNCNKQQAEDYIIKALDFYKRYREKQRER